MRHTAVPFVLLCAVLAAPAGAIMIDNFRDGRRATEAVEQGSIGTHTVVETQMTSILGGTRRLSIEATKLDVAGADAVSAAVVRTPGRLTYDSSVGGDGRFKLAYDGGGSGLQANLSTTRGIALKLDAADLSALPCPVTLTITDASGGSAIQTQNVTQPTRSILRFMFKTMSGVDLSQVRSIELALDPGAAGDINVQWIRTFGARRSPRAAQ